ncbi:MAG TPA: MBL fold metallo-hydrolase [Methanospirillum sp.]|nr:MBL fold metallo-hydrolase [Methanospirillum sp.]
MKVQNLTGQSTEYTSNAYHVSGKYLQLTDQNAMIDVGRDPAVLGALRTMRTGIGKKPIDTIFLTHSHFDHAGLLKEILNRYPVPVYAHPESRIEGIVPVQDGELVKIGDQNCEVIWACVHSEDSVCYYCPEDKILFSGDIPIRIYTNDGIYGPDFLPAFERICSYDLDTVYPGHGDPITGDVAHLLKTSLQNLRESNFT